MICEQENINRPVCVRETYDHLTFDLKKKKVFDNGAEIAKIIGAERELHQHPERINVFIEVDGMRNKIYNVKFIQ